MPYSSPEAHEARKVHLAPSYRRYPAWVILLFLIGIGLALSLSISAVQWLQEEQAKLLFIGLDGMCFYLAIGLGVLLAVLVALIRFRPSRRSLAIFAATVNVVCFCGSKFFRIDGYYGNRTPRITWSWTPKAESQIKSYLTSLASKIATPVLDYDFAPTEADFPELLGKNRLGNVAGVDLVTDWSQQPPKLLWRHPVGLGWSGFAIVGNAAVNLEQRDEYECVVCYDVRTGLELWCHREMTRFNHEYGDGPRSTPTIREGRVFSMGATGVLTCVNFRTGALHWKQSVFNDPVSQNLVFGMTGSPVVFEDKVVVTPGAGVGASAIAYFLETGAEAWRCGDDQASYASPVVASVCGQQQILSFNGAGLRSYGVGGQVQWLQPWVTQGDSRVNVAQPIVLGQHDLDPSPSREKEDNTWANILISSGYDKGTALVRVTRSNEGLTPEILWESKLLKSKLSNFVVHQRCAYGLDNGILACIDLANGERLWKSGRYGHGKILLVKDNLLIQAESGEIVLVAASPNAHQELAKFEALTSKTWNNLALAGDILVVRNDREAAAFRLPVNE